MHCTEQLCGPKTEIVVASGPPGCGRTAVIDNPRESQGACECILVRAINLCRIGERKYWSLSITGMATSIVLLLVGVGKRDSGGPLAGLGELASPPGASPEKARPASSTPESGYCSPAPFPSATFSSAPAPPHSPPLLFRKKRGRRPGAAALQPESAYSKANISTHAPVRVLRPFWMGNIWEMLSGSQNIKNFLEIFL